MPELKTKATDASVSAYIDAIEEAQRREDCRTLVSLFSSATKYDPRMWGTSIVGFGSYHYRYASGHEGDACLAGFSSRKGSISIYIPAGFEGAGELLSRLGKHKTAKACLYVKRLADIDQQVLKKLIANSVVEMKHRYPSR